MSLISRTFLAALVACLAACSGGGREDAAPSSPGLLATSAAAFSGQGTWWNPAEPGSGFVFEAQGSTGVITYFTYEAGGKPVWYSGAGAFALRADGKYAFSATLFRYSGGQPANSSTPKTPTRTEVGATSVVFDGDTAQVTIPGRNYAAKKFNPTTASGGRQPEAGIYWNPNESGRGYTMEVANNVVSIGVFHYDANGQPTWHLVVGDMAAGKLSAPFTSYSGGQAFGGPYKAPTAGATTQQFQASFDSACRGDVQFPGMAPVAVSRFAFGGLPAGAECRSAALVSDGCSSVAPGFSRGDIENVLANPGFAGGDGGTGGDGGGAAAGGGLGKVLGGLLRVTDLSDGSLVGEAITDARDGLVTVKTCKRPGPFLLTLEGRSGARYFDEGLNHLTDFGAGQVLHALVDQWDEHVGVSPLTEAAYRYALNNFAANAADVAARRAPLRASGSLVGLTKAQAIQANERVKAEINARFNDNYRLDSVKSLPTPIDADSGATAWKSSRYGRSAAVNGGLVKAANYHNPAAPAPALAMGDQLARDFTDGMLDGFALDGSSQATVEKPVYESNRLPLAGQYAAAELALRFAVNTLATGPLEVHAWEWLTGVYGPPIKTPGGVDCTADDGHFQEHVGLLSNGNVSVQRITNLDADGKCILTGMGRAVEMKSFVTAAKQVIATDGVAYAVKKDGTVVGWGHNLCGALGPHLPYGVYGEPQTIAGLRNITSLSSSEQATIARDSAGNVFVWGIDYAATSATTTSAVPGRTLCASGGGKNYFRYPGITQVAGLSGIAKVFTQTGTYFAIAADGRLFAWGSGIGGRLANGVPGGGNDTFNGPDQTTPAPIAGLAGVRDLAFQSYLQFAILSDGSVKAWGLDLGGTRLRAEPKVIARPTAIPAFQGTRQIGVTYKGVFLLKSDGSTWQWKDNEVVLNFDTTTRIIPTGPVRHLSASASATHLLVFFRDGRLDDELTGTFDFSIIFR